MLVTYHYHFYVETVGSSGGKIIVNDRYYIQVYTFGYYVKDPAVNIVFISEQLENIVEEKQLQMMDIIFEFTSGYPGWPMRCFTQLKLNSR